MLFTSYEFLGFLAVVFLLYYILPARFQKMFLLIASYIFYATAGVKCLLFIMGTTLTVYFTAIMIGNNTAKQRDYLKAHKDELSREDKKNYKEGQKKIRTRWIVLGLLINIGILGVVKYTNFFIANINSVTKLFGTGQLSFVNFVLPMGISFYTFQAIGYLIDVYRGAVEPERNLFRFALFISFFPQLVQGPISRFEDLSRTLFAEHPFEATGFFRGLQRILWGFFKKLVIADRLFLVVGTIIGDTATYNGAYTLLMMLMYTVELYADFTGGIDITIGVAQALGIEVMENFNRPYFSKSLKEYWRRWHISMCNWFRDYLFYPVSTSKWMQKFTKFSRRCFGDKVGKRLPMYVSSFVVWFTTGIWHGASWNFIIWGLCNWAVLMVSEELEPLYAAFHKKAGFAQGRIYDLFQIGRTFLLICFMNLFDCFATLGETFGCVASIFTAGNWHVFTDGSLLQIGFSGYDYVIVALGCTLLVLVSLWQRSGSVREKIGAKAYPLRFCIWFGLFLVTLIFGIYGIGYDSSQFIYNRF